MKYLILLLALASCGGGLKDGSDCTFISAYGTCVDDSRRKVSEFEFNLVQAAFFEEAGSGRAMMGELKVVFFPDPVECGPVKAAGCYYAPRKATATTLFVQYLPEGSCLFWTSLAHEMLHAWYDRRTGDPTPGGDERVQITSETSIVRHVDPNFWGNGGLVWRVQAYGPAFGLCQEAE